MAPAVPLSRWRLWVNGTRIDVGREWVTGDEADRAYSLLLDNLLRLDDWWVVATEKSDGTHWFTGGDPLGQLYGDRAVALARRIAADDYGEKLPDGEVSWQQRHGARVPPETFLPGADE